VLAVAALQLKGRGRGDYSAIDEQAALARLF
jgi:hypothetical protein